MNIIGLYLGGCLIGGGIAGIMAAATREKKEPAPVPENEGRAGYLLAGYDLPEREEGAGVYGILLGAFRSLQEQKAARYRGWISACIEMCQKGYSVPVDVALLALRRTLNELEGPRYEKEGEPTIYFNLDGLTRAIAELEREIELS